MGENRRESEAFMSNRTQYQYQITEEIAVLSASDTTTLEINKLSWNGKEPKFDLRAWGRKDGEKIPFKGICISDAEAEALYLTLRTIFEDTTDADTGEA
jgi:hypothetical protein